MRSSLHFLATAWLAGVVVACSGATQSTAGGATGFSRYPQPYTEADVHFMAGMIVHHAQAVLMARWAPTHGAGPAVTRLCERILISQRDEIAFMQKWLRDRAEMVPDADATHMTMMMGGEQRQMTMPGMLTNAQLAELDAARGRAFDRLFLTYMIQHHEGALVMVDELYNSYGAAQDDIIFKFSSDVWADQTAEIERMQNMLAEMSAGGGVRDDALVPAPRF